MKMKHILARQYGHRPDWTADKQPPSKGNWKQPEDVIGTTSQREDLWRLLFLARCMKGLGPPTRRKP